jgi:hypothetical protein
LKSSHISPLHEFTRKNKVKIIAKKPLTGVAGLNTKSADLESEGQKWATTPWNQQGYMTKSKSVILAIAAAGLAGLSVQAQVVAYNNAVGYPTVNGEKIYTDVHFPEIGDEINLTTGPSTVVNFQFEYRYTGPTSDSAIGILRFYALEPAAAGGFLPAATPLLESAPFDLVNGDHTVNTGDISVAVPGRFVWAVTFLNTGGGTPAGLIFGTGAPVSDGPGGSGPDHWERDPVNGWNLYDSALGIDNFRALVTVVPEPGTVALMVAGGAALLASARRRKA